MSFKDQIETDLNVFLNIDEFGELAVVDGVRFCVVLFEERRDANTVDGVVSYDVLMMHAAEADLQRLPQGVPVVNRELRVNGRRYVVSSVTENLGMFDVELQRSDV